MTRSEVTEIFALLKLSYPNAEVFRASGEQALKAQLKPYIQWWAECLQDIDAWTGRHAVVEITKTSKFFPSIAEFREAAEGIEKRLRLQASDIRHSIWLSKRMGKEPNADAWLLQLYESCQWQEQFEAAYVAAIKQSQTTLPGSAPKQLGE